MSQMIRQKLETHLRRSPARRQTTALRRPIAPAIRGDVDIRRPPGPPRLSSVTVVESL
jgi:hypothetical protein